MYELNGQQFKTKESLKKYIQQIIKLLDICNIDSNHDYYNMFNELILQHESKEEKIGCGISYFAIRKNPQNNAERSLYVCRIDGTETVWSYKTCIGINKNYLNEAMRSAIKEQIYQYKKTQEMKCCICYTTEAEFHVDHKTIPFCSIKDNFLKLSNEVPKTFEKDKKYLNMIFKEEDIDFKEKWLEYHRQQADYQILCKSCNILKSNK